MIVLSSTGASRYHNCCIDGGTSPEYFGFTLIMFAELINYSRNIPIKFGMEIIVPFV
jgi:hypothetical protein